VIVHDELDLPPGVVRVKQGGGLAGHKGLQSIKSHLHSAAFSRVRIGIGKPPGGKERGADHVLAAPGKREQTELAVSVEIAADAVELILTDGVDVAQNRVNGGGSPAARNDGPNGGPSAAPSAGPNAGPSAAPSAGPDGGTASTRRTPPANPPSPGSMAR